MISGADLVLTDLDGAAVAEVAAAYGDRAIGLAHDVSSADAWSQVADAAQKRFGRVDVLVNNAGFCPEGAARRDLGARQSASRSM